LIAPPQEGATDFAEIVGRADDVSRWLHHLCRNGNTLQSSAAIRVPWIRAGKRFRNMILCKWRI
jgi:hypothetical protein